MKSLFQKIMSLILAFLVLLSTTSFSINKHYCCEKLVDVSIFGKAKSCEQLYKSDKVENIFKHKNPPKQCTSENNDCCNDIVFVKSADNDIQAVTHLVLDNQIITFGNLFFYTYLNLFENLENNIVPFKYYNPPLVIKDILVLHETFLI